MKKSIKRAVALLLCVLSFASLCSCGDSGDNNKEVQVVNVWTTSRHNKDFMNEKVSEWNETVGKKEGIRIEYAVHEGNFSEKIKLAYETDQAPELFQGGSVSELAEKEYIAPLDELKGMEDLIEQFGKYAMIGKGKHTDGKIYSLPKTSTTYGLIYNKDMFKAAGIVDENGEPTPPKTLAEMREYAKRLTNESKKEYGIIFPGKFSAWYQDDVQILSSASSGFFGGYNPKTGKFDYSYEAEVMKTLLGIKKDGSCYPGVEGLDNDPARARFATGGIGMKTAASYDYGVLTDQFPAEIDWGVAPLPVIDENDKYLQYMGVGGAYFVNKTKVAEKEEAIVKVLHFLYSDEMLTDAYKLGYEIPLNNEIIEKVAIDDKENWAAFASMVPISSPSSEWRKYNLQGGKGMKKVFLEEIWPGNFTDEQVDKSCREVEDTLNNTAVQYYESIHPEYDVSIYIVPEWDTKRND